MIVDCPGCGKRISSKYTTCPHCRLSLGGDGDGITVEEVSRRLQIRQSYRIQAQLYASIFLAVVGVAWAYASSGGMERAPGVLPLTVFAAGGLWYIAIRIYMIVARMRRRAS